MKDRLSAAEYRAGAARVPSEEQECLWLFEWAQATRWCGMPISQVLIHIPNGTFAGYDRKGAAITKGKLKAQGLQPGVFDYLIPVPKATARGELLHGLWLEMKRTKGGAVSREQEIFGDRMEALGYLCEIAKGWVAASKIIGDHLELKGRSQ